MPTKKYALPDTAFDPIDDYEAELMAAIEAGALVVSENSAKEAEMLAVAAANTLAKKRQIRRSERSPAERKT